MTTDWYLFWQQHYQHPLVSEWDLSVAILTDGLDRMRGKFAEAFVPVMKRRVCGILAEHWRIYGDRVPR